MHQLAAIDRAQQLLARRMATIRRSLAEIRVLAFPTLDKDLIGGYRRVARNAPAAIPPASPNAVPLTGPHVRHAAIAILLRAGRALPLPEIHRRLHLDGYRIEHRFPVKRLADALAYEERNGRAVRTRRGCYALGTLSPRQRRNVLSVADDARSQAA